MYNISNIRLLKCNQWNRFLVNADIQWRIQGAGGRLTGGGRPPPTDLTNFCINVKSNPRMHQNPSVSGKNSNFFLGGGTDPSPDPSSSTVRPYYKILDPLLLVLSSGYGLWPNHTYCAYKSIPVRGAGVGSMKYNFNECTMWSAIQTVSIMVNLAVTFVANARYLNLLPSHLNGHDSPPHVTAPLMT